MTFYAEDLAYCHHVGFADSRLPPAVLALLREFGIGGGTVLDLGCNGGHLLAALTTAGFKAIGVDVSAPALALAAETAPQAELHCADIGDFTFPSAHAVTALGEVMFYLTKDGRHALKNNIVLERIYRALAPGGMFLFDIVARDPANRFQYRNRRAEHDWRIDHGVHENRDGTRLHRDIAIDRQVSGRWRRSRETHRLYLHDPDKIAQRLQQCGFSVDMADRIGPVETLPRRVAFICRKAAC
ncbi:MAG: hypothetical protein CMM59_03200 [Rhodospirillaceae bacterium]|nr:hypothetical protein [Rhodospirillaceae bacterium]